MQIINDILENRLLTCSSFPAGTYDFWSQDTKKKWKQNREKLGDDWEYSRKSLAYTINSQNYRAPEWDQIDWAESIVIYGCSFVFGEGIDDSDTIAAQLERMVGRTVINLGACGSGVQWQVINQSLLLTNFCEPWASVVLWPNVNRTVLFEDPVYPKNQGSWNLKREHYFTEYNRGCNPLSQFYFFRNQSRLMHKKKWIEASWNLESNSDYAKLGVPLLRYRRDARDLSHPGRSTMLNAATWIAGQL